MGTRRKGREGALQLLYQLEAFAEEKRDLPRGVKAEKNRALHTDEKDVSDALAHFFENFDADERARNFTTELLLGVVEHAEQIDDAIRTASPRWRLERMGMVDRNVLRLGAFELLYRRDVPTRVILDEGIEIARRFGTEDSPAFVNGVLDAIGKEGRASDAKAADAGSRAKES